MRFASAAAAAADAAAAAAAADAAAAAAAAVVTVVTANSRLSLLIFSPFVQGRCVICGGPGISDAYYCRECAQQEKDVSGTCRRRRRRRRAKVTISNRPPHYLAARRVLENRDHTTLLTTR